MNASRTRRPLAQRGFTLIEMMIVGSIIVIAVSVAFPAFTKMKRRAELIGELNEATFFLRAAQREAVKMGVAVAIEVDVESRELFGFANVDGDEAIEFNPDPAATFRTVDYEVGRHALPRDLPIFLRGPGNEDAVDGLENGGSGKPILLFLSNGAVQTPGAIRIADAGLNVFELRLNATGRIKMLKHHPEPSWGGEPGFFPNGAHRDSGARLWEWF